MTPRQKCKNLAYNLQNAGVSCQFMISMRGVPYIRVLLCDATMGICWFGKSRFWRIFGPTRNEKEADIAEHWKVIDYMIKRVGSYDRAQYQLKGEACYARI